MPSSKNFCARDDSLNLFFRQIVFETLTRPEKAKIAQTPASNCRLRANPTARRWRFSPKLAFLLSKFFKKKLIVLW